MYEKILAQLAGSKYNESVFSHVMMLAVQRVAELIDVVLLRVYEIPFLTADYAMWDVRRCLPCRNRIKIDVEN